MPHSLINPEGLFSIGGTVTHQGLPVSGATVRLEALPRQTVTDDYGRFTLHRLPDGHYILIANTKNQTATMSFTLPPEPNQQFSFDLEFR